MTSYLSLAIADRGVKGVCKVDRRSHGKRPLPSEAPVEEKIEDGFAAHVQHSSCWSSEIHASTMVAALAGAMGAGRESSQMPMTATVEPSGVAVPRATPVEEEHAASSHVAPHPGTKTSTHTATIYRAFSFCSIWCLTLISFPFTA